MAYKVRYTTRRFEGGKVLPPGDGIVEKRSTVAKLAGLNVVSDFSEVQPEPEPERKPAAKKPAAKKPAARKPAAKKPAARKPAAKKAAAKKPAAKKPAAKKAAAKAAEPDTAKAEPDTDPKVEE